MDHYPLVLVAVYSVALLQLAQNPSAQSGAGDAPRLQGSGSGERPEHTYEEIMEMAMNSANTSTGGAVQPGSNGTTAAAGSFEDSFCSPYAHYLTLEYAGCVTTYPTFSCTGRCHTGETPHHFYERRQSYTEAFVTTCTCCSTLTYSFQKFIFTLDCPDNSTINVVHITAFATKCGCAACY